MFTSALVTPHYSSGSAVIRWGLAPELNRHGVLVYRSSDGSGKYELITQDPVRGVEYLDADLPVDTNQTTTFYKLDVEDLVTGEIQDGPVLTMSMRLSPADVTTARRMMMAFVKTLRKGPGLPAFLFLPGRPSETPNEGFDPNLEMPLSICAFNSTGGVAYQFHRPHQTWVQLGALEVTKKTRTDGTGTDDETVAKSRLPGFPCPVTGSLVVIPGLDDRYVVGDTVHPAKYRALVPILYDVVLSLLPRSDPRYSVAVPELDTSLTQPAYTQ